jgi:hypothetical protein
LQSLAFLSGFDPSTLVYGSGLRISLLGTGGATFTDGTQQELVFVDGRYGKTLRGVSSFVQTLG